MLSIDEKNSFDLRFQIRGAQPPSGQILIVEVNPLNEALPLIVQKLLSFNPEKIGITPSIDSRSKPKWVEHPKVVWAQMVEQAQPSDLPFASSVSLLPDSDSFFRRYHPQEKNDFIARLSGVPLSGPRLINFLGPTGTFERIRSETLLKHPKRRDIVEGRTLLLSSHSSPIATPVGPMSRSEFFANLIENTRRDMWITRFNKSIYSLLQLALLVFSIWLLLNYPQTASFILFLWVGTAMTAFSLWIFDTYFIWIPVVSPGVQLFSTFVIFISFQLALQEKKHWKLTQKARAKQEIEQLKDNFVSLFSHDLKSPIARIQAILDRLLAHHPEAEMAGDLKTMRKSTDELHSYIQKILQISKVESRQIKLRKETIDINSIVQKVVSRIQPLAIEHGIKLAVDLSPLFSVDVDVTLIEEVILNLVDNAIKYSPDHSRVRIRTQETSESVVITITDQGQGISEQDQERIWDKFSRGRNQDVGMKGFGLGLYLAKYFIELHNGCISMKSVPGAGTTVSFEIPFENRDPLVNNEYYFSPKAFSKEESGMEWIS